MEEESYADIIDAYESGVGVVEGESLTDYIKRNNIKIKEIQTEDLTRGRPMEKEGIESIQLASGNKNMDINIETVVKEFIRRKKRKPNSIEEIKDFYFNEMGSAGTGASNRDNVQLAAYEPGDYDPAMVEAYEQYKYDMNEQKPGFPVMEIDEFIRMERSNIATGGLAGILGA